MMVRRRETEREAAPTGAPTQAWRKKEISMISNINFADHCSIRSSQSLRKLVAAHQHRLELPEDSAEQRRLPVLR